MPDARIEIEVEDGCLDAFVACPDDPGRHPPVLLLPDRSGLTPEVERFARRVAVHGYFTLAPDWPRRRAEDRREDAEAWLDHLADERRVDDTRIGAVGLGSGANLALRVAAWRAERIAAVAAYGGRGFGPATAREIAQRINAVVRLGYELGAESPRMGFLEAAFCEAGVNFDFEVAEGGPDLPGLLDLLARTLRSPVAEQTLGGGRLRGADQPLGDDETPRDASCVAHGSLRVRMLPATRSQRPPPGLRDNI